MRGLAEYLWDHLTALELPNDVDSLIALVIKIDNRIQLREEERSRLHVNAPSRRGPATDPRLLSWRSPARFSPVAASPAPPADLEEPMQLGRTRLTAEERQRRLREGRCIYCGQMGHFISGCPLKSQTFVRNALVSHTTFSSLRPVIQAQLITSSQTVNHPVLVDSGADESFMDWRLAKRLELELISLPKPLEAHALDGRLLCRVTQTSRISPGFLRATSISRRFSIRPGPALYPLTDLMHQR